MFACNSYIILSIISIILIISIIILVLVKTHKLSNNEIEPFEFVTDNEIERIEQNNEEINDKINENIILSNDKYIISKYDDFVKQIYNDQEFNQLFNDSISNNINENQINLNNNINENNDNIKETITTLKNKLSDLKNITNNLNINKIKTNKYSKIKSLNNGQEFCLNQTPNTKFTNPKSGYLTDGYMVNMNNGCLSVGASDYNIYKCNDKNQKHLFNLEHIINEKDYELNIDKLIPFDGVDLKNVKYPFALLKSVNNNNCLTNKNGNITVQPCNSFVAQRWIPL